MNDSSARSFLPARVGAPVRFRRSVGASSESSWTIRRFLTALLALVLAISLAPIAQAKAFAEEPADGLASQNEATLESLKAEMLSDEGIAALLSESPYNEGEALVVVDNAVAAGNPSIGTRSIDLLDSAEPLMDASAASLAEATGIDVAEPEASPLSADGGGASAATIRLVKAPGMSTEDLLYALRDDPRVISAEPNYTYSLVDPAKTEAVDISAYVEGATGTAAQPSSVVSPAAVSDAKDLTNFQWAYSGNTSVLKLAGLNASFDMDVPLWKAQRTDPTVENATGTVAVIDTGIDYLHPDLAPVMRNDMIGFADYGFDCGYAAVPSTSGDGPMDDNSHGTHVAGIIASKWNDSGTSGIASGSKLIAVKAADVNGAFASSSLIKGYAYLADAVRGGLDDLVSINNSWGGPNTNYALALAVTELGRLGAISVFASGNSSLNTDTSAQTVSTLRSNPYVVVVDSTTRYSEPSWFTNYGRATTDVFAPGSTILSTYPRSMAKYLPEARDAIIPGHPTETDSSKNIIFESFSDSNPDVARALVHSTPDSATALGSVQLQACYDTEGGSLRVPLSGLTAVSDNELNGCITVKAGPNDPWDIDYFGWHYYTDGSPSAALAVYAEVVDDKGNKEWLLVNGDTANQSVSNEWFAGSCNIAAACRDAGVTLALEWGAFRLKFRLLSPSSAFDLSKNLYIDAVGVGGPDAAVPYSYDNGTSMAAPAVTGAAAVIAKTESSSTPPTERAAARAMALRGSVRPIASMADLCASGGAVDLGVLASGQMVPVVLNATTVTLPGDKVGVEVSGGYFGAAAGTGTVTIDGEPATVVSWGEELIVVECPAGVSSGPLLIQVTTDLGRVGQRIITLDLPSPPAESATPLYENEYALPQIGNSPATAMDQAMIAGLGGKLYLLPQSMGSMAAEQLWVLDPSTGAWSQCADLPASVQTPTMAAYEKTLLVGGMFEDSDGHTVWSILQYDPATNSWDQTDMPIATFASLANVDGMLVSVGGLVTDEDAGTSFVLDEIRSIDLKAKTSEVVGHLDTPMFQADVNSGGTTLTVGCGFAFDENGKAVNVDGFARYGLMDEKFVGGDELAALPVFDEGGANNFRLAVTKEGIVSVGFTALAAGGSDESEDEDTYLLASPAPAAQNLASGGADSATPLSTSMFEGYGKRFMYGQTYNQAVAAYDGQLYAIGYLNGGADGLVLRSTAIATYSAAGDTIHHPDPDPQPLPTPGPDSDSGSNALAMTGDGVPLVFAVWSAAAACGLVALLLASGGLRRTTCRPSSKRGK